MKIVELFTGLRYMMTNEQKEIINLLKQEHIVPRSKLEERQQHLAERMTSLGLIDRIYDENSQAVAYKLYTR